MTSWSLGSYHVNVGLNPSDTRFGSFGTNVGNTFTESDATGAAQFTGTWSLLAIEVVTNTLSSATLTIRARVEASNVNQTMTITFGQTGNFQDTSNTDNVTQGDKISVSQTVASGGSGSVEVTGVGWKYA